MVFQSHQQKNMVFFPGGWFMALILPTGTQDLNLAFMGSAVVDRWTNALWPWGMDISSATEISQSPVDSSGGPPSDDLGQNVTNQCRCCQVSLHPNDLFAVCFEPPASQIGITTSDTQVADQHARHSPVVSSGFRNFIRFGFSRLAFNKTG